MISRPDRDKQLSETHIVNSTTSLSMGSGSVSKTSIDGFTELLCSEIAPSRAP